MQKQEVQFVEKLSKTRKDDERLNLRTIQVKNTEIGL